MNILVYPREVVKCYMKTTYLQSQTAQVGILSLPLTMHLWAKLFNFFHLSFFFFPPVKWGYNITQLKRYY